MTTGAGIQFVPFPANAGSPEVGPRAREIQELWFNLSRLRWSSLVVVPADEGLSGEGVARSLAEVGSRLRDTPVTAILASSMDYESARFLADLNVRVRDHRGDVERAPAVEVASRPVVTPPPAGHVPPPGGAPDADGGEDAPSTGRTEASGSTHHRDASLLPPVGQVVVAIQPVIVEPLGVAIAHAADAVVLCVKLGQTRMRSVRKTLELVGPARHVSAILVR